MLQSHLVLGGEKVRYKDFCFGKWIISNKIDLYYHTDRPKFPSYQRLISFCLAFTVCSLGMGHTPSLHAMDRNPWLEKMLLHLR